MTSQMNSKKLSGNGLWESSRMLLPEHREALAQRRADNPPETNRMPTMEELVLVKNAVLLPIILTIAESNLRKLEMNDYSLKKLYVIATKILIDRLIRDIGETKKLLKQRGITVYEEEKLDGALRIRFTCRGYEDDISILRDLVKSEIGVKIKAYIESILSPLMTKKSNHES